MRSTWTDDLLDDLKDQVAVIDGKVDRLDGKVSQLDTKIERLDGKFDSGFGRLDERIDRLNHTMIQAMAILIGTIFALAVALVGIVAAHA